MRQRPACTLSSLGPPEGAVRKQPIKLEVPWEGGARHAHEGPPGTLVARACAVAAVRRRAEAPPLTVAQSLFGAKLDPESDGGLDGTLGGCRAAGAARVPGPCGRLALGGRSCAQKGIGHGERGKRGWPGLLRPRLPGFLAPRLLLPGPVSWGTVGVLAGSSPRGLLSVASSVAVLA